MPTSTVASASPRARSSSMPVGQRRRGRERRLARAVEAQHVVGRRGRHDQVDELVDPRRRLAGRARGRAREALEVPLEQERPAAVDAQRLERRAAAQERLVAGAEDRLGRIDQPAPGNGDREQRHAATSPPTAARSGRALTHDSSISASGSESHTMPPPTQRCTRPVGDRERADREREVEVAVRRDGAERAHRRAAPDRLEPCDVVDGGDLRRAGDRAARERRRAGSRRGRRPAAQPALDASRRDA